MYLHLLPQLTAILGSLSHSNGWNILIALQEGIGINAYFCVNLIGVDFRHKPAWVVANEIAQHSNN